MDLSEEDLLSAIARVLSGAGPEVVVGVGDDAAVVASGAGQLVLTTDAMVEGTHFSLATISARDLGYKAIVVNVSDIAAMAASPRYALCALTLSDSVDAAWTIELFGGMREACNEYALWLVGGNLAAGPQVSVAVTVTGEVAPGRAVLGRSSARGPSSGDRIPRGLRRPSAHPLRGGRPRSNRALFRSPFPAGRPRRRGRRPVAERATAMIDVSDGLSLDLSRVCRRVGPRIAMADIPVAAGRPRGGAGRRGRLRAARNDSRRGGAHESEGGDQAVLRRPTDGYRRDSRGGGGHRHRRRRSGTPVGADRMGSLCRTERMKVPSGLGPAR